LGLVPFASLYLIKRYFFAYEDARTPFLVQIPIAAITLLSVPVILNLVDPQWAAMAAAGSTSFGNLVAWAMGLWMLRRRAAALGVETPSQRAGTIMLVKLGGAGVVSWLVGTLLVALADDLFWIHRGMAVLLGSVVGALMTVVFLAVAWVLRVDEVRGVVGLVERRIGRGGGASSERGATLVTGGSPQDEEEGGPCTRTRIRTRCVRGGPWRGRSPCPGSPTARCGIAPARWPPVRRRPCSSCAVRPRWRRLTRSGAPIS